MVMGSSRYENALRDIARMAAEAVGDDMPGPDGAEGPDTFDAYAGCRIMPLPPRLQQKGAELAERLNPANAPLRELPVDSDGELESPLRLTLRTTKYWGPAPKTLTVSFMETTAADLRTRIVSHLNAWADYCGMTFTETSGTGDVRISRGSGGYWSYLGTDIKLIPVNRQTMNLQGFTMSTPESEYHRVIRHEAGHTLAFPHEHMRRALVERIDPEKAYAYFLRTQGWSKEMVDQQVLTPLDATTIIGTEPDQDSIMCYQLPGEITKDGEPIRGGTDINDSDARFAGLIYPTVLTAPEGAPATRSVSGGVPAQRATSIVDWDPQDDVLVTPR
jgi:hypothetical protein